MSLEAGPKRANNFSLLRMVFAAMVILSHSFDLLDGGPERQPLYRLFGTVTFGAVAVDGFFIVSGYLITQSLLNSSRLGYLGKRVLRIYPGFIVAFIVSVVFCLVFSGHSLGMPGKDLAHNLLNLLFLAGPDVADPYPGSHFPGANGSMWTISYEFHCYLAVLLLGALGCFRRPWVVAGLAVVLLGVFGLFPEGAWPPVTDGSVASMGALARGLQRLRDLTVGLPVEDIRLTGMFLAGAGFYCFRERVVFGGRVAAGAAVALCLCLFSRHLAEPAFAVLGGYLIFWFALGVPALGVSRFFNRTDLSYGMYLYAFPIQKVLISQFPGISHYGLFAAASALSAVAAYLSWTLVERPSLGLKARLRPRSAAAARAA